MFYRQGHQPLLPGDFREMHNLLLLWKANANGDFKGLSLVYPLSPSFMKWRAEIPHPAQLADISTLYQAAFEEVGDLDIEPLDEDEDEDYKAEGQ